MRALIVGDRPALIAQIRVMVNRCDYDCRDADQAPLQSGAEHAGTRPPRSGRAGDGFRSRRQSVDPARHP